MNQAELEQIVGLVTEQVLQAMQCSSGEDPQAAGKPKVLVLAKPGVSVPEALCEDAVVYGLEDYRINQNIQRYDRVVIASLNLTQLADIAQGRIGDEVSCAVIHALLNGMETLLLESALPHRKYAGKGSMALYHVLESYARTLQVFGIKLLSPERKQVVPEAKPPKYAAPVTVVPKGSAAPNLSRLITEAEALSLIQQGQSVRLPAGAIVTPSARDVFAQAKVELVQDR